MRRLLLTVLLAIVPPVAAQAPAADLADLQVTATRAAADRASVPAAVTVISGEELRARGITYLLDALGDVPGAMMAQSGSYGAQASLFLRGAESDHAKVMVDGVTMNNPGGYFDFGSLSLEDVDRIEIVRGPVSVLYGADAIAGVVQVFTRTGDGRLRGEVEARSGSFGGRDVRGAVRGSSGALRGAASFSRFASDGIYAFNNRFEDVNATMRLGVDGGARGTVDAVVRWSDAMGRFPTDGSGNAVDRNQRRYDDDLALAITASRDLGRTLRLGVEAWSHRLDADARNEQDSAADTTGFGFAGRSDAILSRRGAGIHADWRAGVRVRLSGGVGVEREAEHQRSVTHSNFGFGAFVDSARFEAERTTRNGWAQLLAGVAPGVDLLAGLRVDDNSAFGTHATTRAGLSWRLADAVRTWGSVGTGFKAPTFSELFAASPFEVGNADLKPETSTSVEIGVEYRRGGVGVSVTAFHQAMRDLIQYISAQPGEPTYANLQGARSRGIEASLTAAVSRAVSVRAHLTLLDTEVTDTGASASVVFTQGETLLRRPATRGGLTLLARPGAAVASVAVSWVGERADADFRDFPAARTTLPSYGTVDASVELPLRSLAGVGATLLARGENLLDAEFQHVFGFPGRGRTLHAGARLTF